IGYGGESRHRDPVQGEESLFGQPVLGYREGIGAWSERLPPGEEAGGIGRDILELVGHDIDGGGETGERRLVVIGGDRPVRRDVESRTLRVRIVDVGSYPETRRGERQHAAQLSATEDADNAARRQRLANRRHRSETG